MFEGRPLQLCYHIVTESVSRGLPGTDYVESGQNSKESDEMRWTRSERKTVAYQL